MARSALCLKGNEHSELDGTVVAVDVDHESNTLVLHVERVPGVPLGERSLRVRLSAEAMSRLTANKT